MEAIKIQNLAQIKCYQCYNVIMDSRAADPCCIRNMHGLYKYHNEYLPCVRDLLTTSISTVTFQLPISVRLLITEYWVM